MPFVGTVFLAFVLGAACGVSSGATVPAGTALTYRFVTNWLGAADEGGSRVFETDLGYRIGIERLDVGLGAVELVPCSVDSALEASAFDLLFSASARADHPYSTDPSRLELALAENLLLEAGTDLGPIAASGAAYCELFWALSPVEAQTPDGVELIRTSVRIEGWIQHPGEEARVPFHEELRVGRGALSPLQGDWREARSTVQVTRYPTRAFDGIGFADIELSDGLFEFALNLLAGSTAEFVGR